MDPLSFIRYLSTLGDVVNLLTITDAIPPIDRMDAETCYLGFELVLKVARARKRLRTFSNSR